MRSDERGITLIELILAVTILFSIITLSWSFVNSSVEDSADINNKIIVQTSVNQLMNNIQKNVHEASLPITDEDEDVEFIAESLAGEGEGKGGSITLNKPKGIRVTYTYKEDKEVVEYEMLDFDGEVIDSAEYGNISNFSVEYKPFPREENNPVNGLQVTVVGRIDSKSNYSVTNVYYTRNTI